MPPRASVTVEEAVAVVEQFMPFFATNKLPIYSSEVWRKMSKALNGKWTSHSMYVNVRENRRKILSIARKNQGIELPVPVSKTKFKPDNDDSDDGYTDLVELDQDEIDLDSYDLIITRKQWRKLRDSVEYISSDRVILKKHIWSNVLSLACYKHVNLPFANSNDSKDPNFYPQ